MRSSTRRAAAGVAAGLVVAVDQLTKSLVLATHLAPGGGLISVKLVRNTGASFGIGAGHPVVIVLVATLFVVVVAWLLARAPSTAVAIWLAIVLGGALGNLADR